MRKAPFEPLLKVMSSLFRQIFSESDVNTSYHSTIRKSEWQFSWTPDPHLTSIGLNVRPVWRQLSGLLDLPENLIFEGHHQGNKFNKSVLADMRDSSSTNSNTSAQASIRGPNPPPQSLRFLNTYLELLRTLASGKLICLCLDDLQFADEESIELISSIVSGKLRIVLLTTCRRVEELPTILRPVLDGGEAHVTRLQLEPLDEEGVVDYVASTLYRSREYVFPLAAVALDKTHGNPFYLRQLLDLCYRKHCVWFNWQTSSWEFNLDRVFAEFESENYGTYSRSNLEDKSNFLTGSQLNTNFLTRQLKDQLPEAARSILAWASLLGNTFSFTIIQSLLSGVFDYVEDGKGSDVPVCAPVAGLSSDKPAGSAVEGLQACLQTSILVPGEDDDHFRYDIVSYPLLAH